MHKMTIHTQGGEITIERNGYDVQDPEGYPGFNISVDGKYLAMVEYNPLSKNVCVIVWDKDDEQEEPIANIVIKE